MAKWEVTEADGGKTLTVKQKGPPPMPYKEVKVWIGRVFMFLIVLLTLAILARDWFG